MSGAIRNIFTRELRVNRSQHLLVTIGVLLIPILSALPQAGKSPHLLLHGAVVRGDTAKPELSLVFTGDAYADGGRHIAHVLTEQGVLGSFFFTGNFYRNPEFESLIQVLLEDGHYLGAHSDQHLLYCSWEQRDSLLVSHKQFRADLQDNYRTMDLFDIKKEDALFFLPPYEWYNDSIARWTGALGLQLVNHTHGTLSHADYTVPDTKGYRNSNEIFQSILDYETTSLNGLNGFILLSHIGTISERTDKFYDYLEQLIKELKSRGYRFKRIDELLSQPRL